MTIQLLYKVILGSLKATAKLIHELLTPKTSFRFHLFSWSGGLSFAIFYGFMILYSEWVKQ